MSRPNLILLTIECWRGDHFGELTPNLMRLAEESAFFTDAYAPGGWTLPSMTAMMSSAYASMFGTGGAGLASPERQALAERLLAKRYWTAGFSANPVCGSMNGFHRGFGTFRDVRRSPPHVTCDPGDKKKDWKPLAEKGIHPRDLDTLCDANEMTAIALRWLRNRQNDEYFLWIHYMDPHWPCITPTGRSQREVEEAWQDRHIFRTEVIPRRGKFDPGAALRSRWIERYRQGVRAVDNAIGQLLDHLRTRKDWDNTVIAVAGDHGEEFFEHGAWHHAWNQLYREGVHVPLILKTPDGHCVVRQPVSHLDIAPTLLDYSGVDQDATRPPMMGMSLRRVIGDTEFPERCICTEMFGHPNSPAYRLSILERGWKYIYDLEDPHNSLLFNLANDRGEQCNLREKEPKIFRGFEQKRLAHVSLGLTSLLKRHASRVEHDTMDDIVREQLVALGYMAD